MGSGSCLPSLRLETPGVLVGQNTNNLTKMVMTDQETITKLMMVYYLKIMEMWLVHKLPVFYNFGLVYILSLFSLSRSSILQAT